MDKAELKKILELHLKWLNNEPGGQHAYLSGADLNGANLEPIKEDFFSRLDLAKDEVEGLYSLLQKGAVDGTAYEGDCACFVGSVAKIRGERYKSLSTGLKPDLNSPTERWFLAIQKGHTPENSVIAKITSEWMREWAKNRGLELDRVEAKG